jgi:AbrB family looped-hinge helix DNA binding protein
MPVRPHSSARKHIISDLALFFFRKVDIIPALLQNLRTQEIRFKESERTMSEYLQVRSNGQITLPAPTRRKAKLNEGDLLEVVVEDDGTIRLIPKIPVDRALAEKYQLDDVNWALKQKGKGK